MKDQDDRCPRCEKVVWIWRKKVWKNGRVYHKQCLEEEMKIRPIEDLVSLLFIIPFLVFITIPLLALEKINEKMAGK